VTDALQRWGLRLVVAVGAANAALAGYTLVTGDGPPVAVALRALVVLGGLGVAGLAVLVATERVADLGAVIGMAASVLALSGAAMSVARDGTDLVRVGMLLAYVAVLLGAALVAGDRYRAAGDTP